MATNQRQRLQKKGMVVQPPKATRASGGTSAPRGAARSGTSGLGQNQVAPNPGRLGPSHPVGGPKPGAGGGAPAPPPAGSGALPPPETQQRLRERDESGVKFVDSEGDWKYGLYQAALKYGDPAVIALYGDPADPPTGAVQEIAKREATGQKNNTNAHNSNNTFFSGMNLEDIKNISNEANNERDRALKEFEAAKHELDELWIEAQNRHRYEEEAFNEGAQAEFEDSEPTPQAPAPGGAAAPSSKPKPKPKPKANPGPAVGQAQALTKRRRR